MAKFAADIGDETVLKQSLECLNLIDCTPEQLAIIRQQAINRGHQHLLHLFPHHDTDPATSRFNLSWPTFVFDRSMDVKLARVLVGQNKELVSAIMYGAAEAGRVDIVRQFNLEDDLTIDILEVADYGHLDLVRHIVDSLGKSPNDQSNILERIFIKAAEVAKYLLGVMDKDRAVQCVANNKERAREESQLLRGFGRSRSPSRKRDDSKLKMAHQSTLASLDFLVTVNLINYKMEIQLLEN
ncbi:hypothetical protein SAMD00019534_010160 [Acytostelium subglobosum LB1]|uniref:hypothetical protein n=1 Tax=Acytostelium subglobosum LB1 TaxID=1410327 RepID=UPI000644D3A2|nr:hypothetical protein SAMD00019534_010160 [Acytostelium subglobosum LB1]GAM17841.1 hypothetical protein SAMD00019534_010160 [Acytostelium subglobosum LB1]|eukprot:XP_012758437.1 hypothetical protein SAMD00019534_010160 [Acytostelium subglobosum LB1]